MKLKYYIRTKHNIEKMAKIYTEVFEGKIYKKSFINTVDTQNQKENDKNLWTYVNLTFFNSISLMIARYNENNMPNFGYSGDFIITFDSKKDFLNTYDKLINSKYFHIDYHPQNYKEWGITITKFYDDFGHGWVLENKI